MSFLKLYFNHFACLLFQVKGNFGNNSVLTWCNYETKKKMMMAVKTVTDRATSQLLATEWDRQEDGLLSTFCRYDLAHVDPTFLFFSTGLAFLCTNSIYFLLSGRRRWGRDCFAASPVTRDGWASWIVSCPRLSRSMQRTSRKADRFHSSGQPK